MSKVRHSLGWLLGAVVCGGVACGPADEAPAPLEMVEDGPVEDDLDLTPADETTEEELDTGVWPRQPPSDGESFPDDFVDESYGPEGAPDELAADAPGYRAADDDMVDGPDAPDPIVLASSNLLFPQKEPVGEATKWFHQKYACSRFGLSANECICRGSPYNCQLPSTQPFRNRYLPPSVMKVLKGPFKHPDREELTGDARKERNRKRNEIINHLGKWKVEEGTGLYDGNGVLRGTLKGQCKKADKDGSALMEVKDSGKLGPVRDPEGTCVKINFGQFKTIGGAQYAYAFDNAISNPPQTGKPNGGFGGWVPVSSIRTPGFVVQRASPRKAQPLWDAQYVVKAAEDYTCKDVTVDGMNLQTYCDPSRDTCHPCVSARFSDKCLPPWTQLKVLPKSGNDTSEKVRDYMLRDGGAINIVYGTPYVGGVSSDTLMVGQDELAFERVKPGAKGNRRTSLRISLFETNGTKPKPRKMTFVYGKVAGRYGWIALDALKKGSAKFSCAGKADSFYCPTSGTSQSLRHCVGGKDAEAAKACPNGCTVTQSSTGDAPAVSCN